MLCLNLNARSQITRSQGTVSTWHHHDSSGHSGRGGLKLTGMGQLSRKRNVVSLSRKRRPIHGDRPYKQPSNISPQRPLNAHSDWSYTQKQQQNMKIVHVLTSSQANEQSCPHDGTAQSCRCPIPGLPAPSRPMSPLDRTEVLAGWPLDAPSLSLAVTVSYMCSACGAVEQFLTTKVAVLLIVGCAFLVLSDSLQPFGL